MGAYLKAENLKLKNTFTKKLILIMPLIVLLLGNLIPPYYEQDCFNWWYTTILLGYISLICFLVHQKENKKLKYIGVMSLPVNLKKVWISKVLLIGTYILISCIILSIGILNGRIMYPGAIKNPMPVTTVMIAGLIIAITSLWQIPLCFFLSKKIGLFPTILINTVVGIVLNLFTVNKELWVFCPYSYTTRLMCPIIRVLPNGLLAKTGDPLLNPNVIFPGLILSIVLFIILTLVTAYWFSKQEVK
ncbi:lantibiotic immunity ABC transporter MutE/EpiE family permease subunit [Haloimpatiens sp. FM7330]|uniref:lantibiotic immunity ABC transporter MutE/EpiE family permease subunit n=1 Tax=Haloimpatiens sp. FM7330 TaxID=3298610 RepID=UPI00363E235F